MTKARTRKAKNSNNLSKPSSLNSLETLEISWINPKELNANPRNHRRHPKRQRDAYRAFVSKLSPEARWLIPVVVNRRTNRLVDGHLRVEDAITNGEDRIPVRYIDVDEAEESYILEYFDAIGATASIDQKALASLHELSRDHVGAIKSKAEKALAQLSKDVAAIGDKPAIQRTNTVSTNKPKQTTPPNESFIPAESDRDIEHTAVNNEVKFESSNPFDLPDLLPGSLALPDDLPLHTWTPHYTGPTDVAYYCESARPYKYSRTIADVRSNGTDVDSLRGCLGFFTEDWRFERTYTDGDLYAELLRSEQWRCVLTPDFSTYSTWPFPLQLFNVYRSRWCGRLWQELGIRIVPTIQYMGHRTNEVVIDTLPECPTIAIQTRKSTSSKTKDYTALIDILKYCKRKLKVQAVLLYGDPSVEKYTAGFLPRNIEYRWLTEYNLARRTKK